jgi:hypothetical protein
LQSRAGKGKTGVLDGGFTIHPFIFRCEIPVCYGEKLTNFL